MAKTREELMAVIKSGYEKALEDFKVDAGLYIAGFLDGMMYQKDGTIPESRLAKALREAKEKAEE